MENPEVLATLSTQECQVLLGANSVGRLAVVADGQPAIYPVNYIIDGTDIVLRTNWSGLTHACPMLVALEVDGIDIAQGCGWRVLVQGMAHDVTDALDVRSETLQSVAVAPWAPGLEPRLLRLVPRRITGQHFGERALGYARQ